MLTTDMTIGDLVKASTYIAASKIYKKYDAPEKIFVLLFLAQAHGLHPAFGLERYDLVDGKPSIKTEVALAYFLDSGGRVEWHEWTDQVAHATFTSSNGSSLTNKWTREQAKAIMLEKWDNGSKVKYSLTSKDVWIQYPKAMLASRLISETLRRLDPRCFHGMTTVEEAYESSDVLPAEPLKSRSPKKKVDPQATEPKNDEPVQPAVESSQNNLQLPAPVNPLPLFNKGSQLEFKDKAMRILEKVDETRRNTIISDLKERYKIPLLLAETDTEKQYDILQDLDAEVMKVMREDLQVFGS